MNRAFKTEFHNGTERPIVTMSVKVNNGKKLKNLDADGTKALYKNLYLFKNQLEAFMEEIKNNEQSKVDA